MTNKNQNFNFSEDEEYSEEKNDFNNEEIEEGFSLVDGENSIDFENSDSEEGDLFSAQEDDEKDSGSEISKDEGDDEETGDEEENSFSDDDEDFSQRAVIDKGKLALAVKLLKNIKENNEKLIALFEEFVNDEDDEKIKIFNPEVSVGEESGGDANILEGVFDGENMIGPDGRHYNVPSNYASKSKLVEGDLLKLTISPRGNFVYKQIRPVERKNLVGELEKNPAGNFFVKADGKKWKVLSASITYFKGEVGDEVVLIVPKYSNGGWAAVENIIKK